MPGKCLRDMALGQLDGCEMGLTVESEEGEVPHLRWSQAPPLPWPRPGSADIDVIVSLRYHHVYHVSVEETRDEGGNAGCGESQVRKCESRA